MKIKRILVVEDEEQTRRSLTIVLEEAGYRVDDAKNGLEALKKFFALENGASSIDLILSDIVMPGMSGLELIDEVRKERLTLPIVVITGYRDNKMTAQLQQRGCLDYIDKPFEPHELVERVARVLERDEGEKISPRKEVKKR
jgi:DNA-binding NtrC family response regulator